MSDTRLRRVSNEDKLHEMIDDYQIQGYSVQDRSERHAEMVKREYGSAGMHVVWFILTFWFTLGFGNVAYLLYAFFSNSKKIRIKID